MSNIKPCPFCGSTDLDYRTTTKDREGVPTAVVCCDCGSSGPWVYVQEGDSLLAADREWNKRSAG